MLAQLCLWSYRECTNSVAVALCWHLKWPMGLGPLAVLPLCFVLPLVMWWGFRYRVPNPESSGEPKFREHFGSLYLGYRSKCAWWEVVWTALTIFFTALTTFSIPMGAYYTVLVGLLLFLASTVIQITFKPYPAEATKLHLLHLSISMCMAGIMCCALLTCGTGIGAAESGKHVGRFATVMVLMLALGFALLCLLYAVRLAAEKSALRKVKRMQSRGEHASASHGE